MNREILKDILSRLAPFYADATSGAQFRFEADTLIAHGLLVDVVNTAACFALDEG